MDPRRHAPETLADQLELGYQPVVCLSLGLTHGARAVTPSPPTPGPAPTPLVQVLALVAAGMAQAGPPANVALDLPRHALDDALPSLVERTLQRYGVLPTAISFVLSANDAMADLRSTSSTVAALRALGCEVGLSGVGATFASVRLLHIVPIDFAELAPSVVEGLLEDPDVLAEASGVLHLAAEAGVPTIASGVDSDAQAQWLRDLGCNLAHGPFFGHPSDWLVLPTTHGCDAP